MLAAEILPVAYFPYGTGGSARIRRPVHPVARWVAKANRSPPESIPRRRWSCSCGASVAPRYHTCPSTNCDQRLVWLIGWNRLPGAAFGAATEAGRGRGRMFAVLRQGLVAPDLSGK